jgi:hypothetical protein
METFMISRVDRSFTVDCRLLKNGCAALFIAELENIHAGGLSKENAFNKRLIMFHKQMLFFRGATAPSGPAPPYYRGFTITLRHTTLGRTPLDW